MLPLPTSYSRITLRTFTKLQTLLNNPGLDAAEKDILVLGLLTGQSRDNILELPLKTRHEYLQKLGFLKNMEQLPSKRGRFSLSARKKSSTFFLRRRRYRLILNVAELSGGQYIDLMNFLKDPDALLDNIHNVLAVIAMPLKWGLFKRPYSGKDHAVRAQLFLEHMSVAQAWPVLVFFCNLSRHLMPATLDYLNRETQTQMTQLQTEAQTFMPGTAG